MEAAAEQRQYVSGHGPWVSLANALLRILEKQGLSTLLVIAGCYWGSVYVANPLVISHIATITRLAENQTTIAQTQTKIVETQELQTEILKSIDARLAKLEVSNHAGK